MNLTETLLFLLVILGFGIFMNQILEIRSLEKRVNELRRQLKTR